MPDAPPIHRQHANRPAWHKQPGADQRHLTGRPWRRLRAQILQRDRGLCVRCRALGRVTPATVVDHKKPVSDGGGDEWTNLQSLCDRCHSLKTSQESTGAQSHPGWLPLPACGVTLITGPPGAGKTTYARAHAGPDDTVIDLDDCFRDVCGVHGHTADRSHLSAALRWRNRQLADLARRRTGHAYVIVAAPTDAECDWWRAKLRAVHVRMVPEMALCTSRVDPSRQPTVARWFEARRANDWKPSR